MTNEIPKELIQSALELCGKKFEEFEEYHYSWSIWATERFLIFLLSPEFLMAYNHKMISTRQIQHWGNDIWWFIAEYQSWNPKSIISLLSKICETNQTTAH